MKVGKNKLLREDGYMTAHGRKFYVEWISKMHMEMKAVAKDDGSEIEAAILLKLAIDIATRSAVTTKGAQNERPEVGDYWMIVDDSGKMDPVCYRVTAIADGVVYFDDDSYTPVSVMMRKSNNWIRIQMAEALREHGKGPRRKNTRGTA